ncbi:MAG TPA: CAP domain-containing protein [Terriglobia bacterium]|nr:CAP domain-containing protein [Terriglobia bacterium]
MRNSKNRMTAMLTVIAMTLITSVALTAPQPDGAKPGVAANPTMLVAMASIPNFPKQSETACPSSADCDGMNALQRQLVEMVDADRLNPANAQETGGKAQPLKWDARLAEAALKHSEDMATQHYFSHVDPNGNTPIERVTRLGVQWRAMGENIAKNFTVAAAEEAFMNEPRFQNNHRGNILNPRYNHIGVGIVQGADGMVYVTQEFAQE